VPRGPRPIPPPVRFPSEARTRTRLAYAATTVPLATSLAGIADDRRPPPTFLARFITLPTAYPHHMDRETMDDLVLLWAKMYLDIAFLMIETTTITAKTFGVALRERAMMDEIEDHLRRVTH
jgi:hypothetical protein